MFCTQIYIGHATFQTQHRQYTDTGQHRAYELDKRISMHGIKVKLRAFHRRLESHMRPVMKEVGKHHVRAQRDGKYQEPDQPGIRIAPKQAPFTFILITSDSERKS